MDDDVVVVVVDVVAVSIQPRAPAVTGGGWCRVRTRREEVGIDVEEA